MRQIILLRPCAPSSCGRDFFYPCLAEFHRYLVNRLGYTGARCSIYAWFQPRQVNEPVLYAERVEQGRRGFVYHEHGVSLVADLDKGGS